MNEELTVLSNEEGSSPVRTQHLTLSCGHTQDTVEKYNWLDASMLIGSFKQCIKCGTKQQIRQREGLNR